MKNQSPTANRHRVLIFGGAFDPVHQGHTLLLKEAQKETGPGLTLVVPTGDQPVHKKKTLLPTRMRLLLLKKALLGTKNTKILMFEIRRNQPTYLWQTLQMIERKWPKAELYLLLGSDNIKTLGSWRHINQILKNPKLTLVIGRRKGFLKPKLPNFLKTAKLHFLKGQFPAIASQKLRQNPPSLIMNCIRFALPPSRLRHTLACKRLSVELARRHGVNPAKAHLAALLHDASRKKERFSSPQEALAHGPKSAKMAKEIFRIRDPEVLDAIAIHTTGKPKMSHLAQILYVADFCAYDRKFKEARKIRALAKKDLKRALCEVTASKINHLKKIGHFIHPATDKFYTWLRG